MRYWLMKSEPGCFSIEDLEHSPGQTASWDGVRNYQARNLLRDEIKVGDKVLFYHSSCAVPAIVGTVSFRSATCRMSPRSCWGSRTRTLTASPSLSS